MDLEKIFAPTKKKLAIALIAFLVLPAFILYEDRECEEPLADLFGMDQKCSTTSKAGFVGFYGLIWISVLLFFSDFEVFFEMLPTTIIQIIISYIVACLAVVFVLDKQTKPKKKP